MPRLIDRTVIGCSLSISAGVAGGFSVVWGERALVKLWALIARMDVDERGDRGERAVPQQPARSAGAVARRGRSRGRLNPACGEQAQIRDHRMMISALCLRGREGSVRAASSSFSPG